MPDYRPCCGLHGNRQSDGPTRCALELLHQDRRERTLPPLQLDAILNEAAQKHAEDMLRRGYYSHRSLEGETGMDRYRAAGGGTSQVVAENIARCEG